MSTPEAIEPEKRAAVAERLRKKLQGVRMRRALRRVKRAGEVYTPSGVRTQAAVNPAVAKRRAKNKAAKRSRAANRKKK